MRRPCCTTLPPSPLRLLVSLGLALVRLVFGSLGRRPRVHFDGFTSSPVGYFAMANDGTQAEFEAPCVPHRARRCTRQPPQAARPQPRLRCLPGAAYEASGARARSTRPDREQERVGTGQVPSACAPRCAVLRGAAERERPPAEDGAHEGPADGRRARPPRRPVLTRCGSECVACWPVRCGLLRGPVFRRRGVRCARMGSAACGGS